MPFSPANEERIKILRPYARCGPGSNRGVRDSLGMAETTARWGDCACHFLIEAEVCAGLRPREDLVRARSQAELPDDMCGCQASADVA